MKNIKLTLFSNKKYDAENLGEIQILESECNATTIDVSFPQEYEEYAKRIDFMDIKGEKWSTSLYAPEDKTNEYGEDFDKLNFQFTIPNEVAKRGELQVQAVAYMADNNIVVPFRILYLTIEKSILYASPNTRKVPDLVIKSYEHANKALAIAEQANENSEHAESLTSQAAESASNAEKSAKNAQNSANSSQESAKNAEQSASEAQSSATAAQNSASASAKSASDSAANALKAEQLAGTANTNSTNAVNTSNNANAKATKTLEIVENLTVSSEELDCEEHVAVNIETNSTNKHKNIKFSIPAPKKGTSYRNKGVWEDNIEYVNDEYFIDTVSIHGCCYFCKVTHKNQQPVPSADSEYWGIVALKGSDAGFTIVDDLNSSNSDYVLSANQGRVLKELIASSIETAIANLVNNSPENLNTLSEIAKAINNDPNFHTTIKNLIKANADAITKIADGTTIVGRSYSIQQADTRNESPSPSSLIDEQPRKVVSELKLNSKIELSETGIDTYSNVISIIPWSDKSAGYPVQIATNNKGVYYRIGSNDSTWGSWGKFTTKSEMESKIADLQTQINNMLNGTTVFTLMKAKTIDLV